MSSTLRSSFNGRWIRAGACLSVITVAACGGGGGSDAGSSTGGTGDGSEVAQTDGSVPASAFNSSNSFLAWVKDFANAGNESGDPVRINKPGTGGQDVIAADETSEPVRLR